MGGTWGGWKWGWIFRKGCGYFAAEALAGKPGIAFVLSICSVYNSGVLGFIASGLLPLKVVSMASRGIPLRWFVGLHRCSTKPGRSGMVVVPGQKCLETIGAVCKLLRELLNSRMGGRW